MRAMKPFITIALILILSSCVHYEDKSAQQSFTAVLTNLEKVDAGQLHLVGVDQAAPASAVGKTITDIAKIKGNTEIATTGLKATQSIGNKAIGALK